MKTPMYDKDNLVKMTITLSPRAFDWLSGGRNMAKLRDILDTKLGTSTVRRVPQSKQEKA